MPRRMPTIFATFVALVWSSIGDRIIAADLSPVEVRKAIDRGVQFLVKDQHNNGSWGQNTPGAVIRGNELVRAGPDQRWTCHLKVPRYDEASSFCEISRRTKVSGSSLKLIRHRS